ncbi:serine/threonine-protein phosphatase 7 long form homolog [Arachis duranensis]|uniref:Serine/threonine-protein phosphatase 7 long form homolog n=1 Tax=Arachis duranensis TaxID=130453 RepID=A0A6P4C541_ARADU|nr:serine/threonine-protein phosphatase 7 long form homolog [Arachis duranensis]
MARQAENDGDINILNEMTHYAGAADFEASPPTLPPPDAIVPYLAEARFSDTVPLRDFTFENFLISTLMERWRPETHTFHLPWGEVTITLQDVAYRLGLRTHGNPVGGNRVLQMSQTDDSETLQQYVRCYIMLLIGGYLMTNKSNNLVHLHWLLLLWDFEECRAFFWGSAVLAWTYQSLSLAAQRGVTDIVGCTPWLMS